MKNCRVRGQDLGSTFTNFDQPIFHSETYLVDGVVDLILEVIMSVEGGNGTR